MTRDIIEQVPVGQLAPNTTFYKSDPSDMRTPPSYRTDTLEPDTLVWVCYPASWRNKYHLLRRSCWVITRHAVYDERPVVIQDYSDRDAATKYALDSGDMYPDFQFRVYRHGKTTNWYERKHCYQTGANDARLYELKHGDGARRPFPLDVGKLASAGLDVLGLGQTK